MGPVCNWGPAHPNYPRMVGVPDLYPSLRDRLATMRAGQPTIQLLTTGCAVDPRAGSVTVEWKPSE